MQEGVAGTIGQLDEAKAFVRVVPLDGSSDGGPEGLSNWTARRRISEIAGRRLVVVVGEITAAGWAKISVSIAHVGFLTKCGAGYCSRHSARTKWTGPKASAFPSRLTDLVSISMCVSDIGCASS
jgi:hypothetical protein